ncbi:MAG: ABC transporter permease subunit [Planctomycetota bacterium]
MIFSNPVLKRELITSLRKPLSFVLLFFSVFISSLIVLILWPENIATSQASIISRKMLQYFISGQLLLIAVMVPASSAGSMTMEKEKLCIDLLISSPIRPFSILIGKYFSSTLFLLILVLCSLPIASICFLVGGVDVGDITQAYLILISTGFTIGMLGLTASTFFARTHGALSITYLIELPFVLLIMKGLLAENPQMKLPITIAYMLFALMVCGFLFYSSWKRMFLPFSTVSKSIEEEKPEEQIGLVLDRTQFPDNLISPMKRDRLMDDSENPVQVKEMTTEVFGQGSLMIRIIIQISVILSVAGVGMVYNDWDHYFVYYLITFSVMITPAFSCSAFTQEKERQTLDLLIVTLLSPQEIVFGKLIASLRISTVLTGFLSIFLVMGWVLNSVNPQTQEFPFTFIKLVSYLLIVEGSIFFCTVLGLFLSLLFKTTLRSMIWTYGIILLFYLAPIFLYKIINSIPSLQTDEFYRFFYLLSPFGATYLIKNPEFLTVGTYSLYSSAYLHITFFATLSISCIFLMQHFFYSFVLTDEL